MALYTLLGFVPINLWQTAPSCLHKAARSTSLFQVWDHWWPWRQHTFHIWTSYIISMDIQEELRKSTWIVNANNALNSSMKQITGSGHRWGTYQLLHRFHVKPTVHMINLVNGIIIMYLDRKSTKTTSTISHEWHHIKSIHREKCMLHIVLQLDQSKLPPVATKYSQTLYNDGMRSASMKYTILKSWCQSLNIC